MKKDTLTSYDEYRSRIEIRFAKEILKDLNKVESLGTYTQILMPQNYNSNLNEGADDKIDIRGFFINRLHAKGLIKNSFTTTKHTGVMSELFFVFDADIKPLREHLKEFINNGELSYEDKIIICHETGYGFYREHSREKAYRTRQHNRLSKGELLILSFVGKGVQNAKDIQRSAEYSAVKSVFKEVARVNNQIKKRGVLNFELIERLPSNDYKINSRVILKTII